MSDEETENRTLEVAGPLLELKRERVLPKNAFRSDALVVDVVEAAFPGEVEFRLDVEHRTDAGGQPQDALAGRILIEARVARIFVARNRSPLQ